MERTYTFLMVLAASLPPRRGLPTCSTSPLALLEACMAMARHLLGKVKDNVMFDVPKDDPLLLVWKIVCSNDNHATLSHAHQLFSSYLIKDHIPFMCVSTFQCSIQDRFFSRVKKEGAVVRVQRKLIYTIIYNLDILD